MTQKGLDYVNIDAINWIGIKRVWIYTDAWYRLFILRYILLTEKDRERLRRFYPELRQYSFDFEIMKLMSCDRVTVEPNLGFSIDPDTIAVYLNH